MKKINCLIVFLFLLGTLQASNISGKIVEVNKMTMSEDESILAKTFLYTGWLSVPDIMSKPYTDLRNNLITQVKERCKDPLSAIQSLNDDDLSWGALMFKFLKTTGRDSLELSNMTLDDYRNTIIVLNNQNKNISISTLQSYSNAKNLNIAYQWWFEQNKSIQSKIDQLSSITSTNAIFDMKDNQSIGMDVLRIVEADESSYKYLGVYHSQVSSNHFVLRLAGSNDLRTWHYITNLGDRSHQGDIKKWGNGYLVANEQDPVEGSNNIRVRFFSSYANLIANQAANDKSIPNTFSSLAEGTPDIRTIIGSDPATSHIVIGFHYYDNGVHDQNAIGILYHFSNWRAWKDVISNYNIQLMGYNGNIGGRSSFSSNGNYVLQEAQITSNDWSSWRFLLGDGAFYYTLHPNTPKGSTSFANQGITSIGSDKFVVTSFMPTEGNQSGERGDLLYVVDFSESTSEVNNSAIGSNDNDVKVYSKGGLINIINAENSQISIYDITGALRTNVEAKSSLESFDLKGMFIVCVIGDQGHKFYKVIN